MKNIHVLPTDKPSKLCYDKHNNLVFDSNARFVKPDNKQHLYITSDEEIKEGDWVYGLFNGGVILRSKYNIPKHTQDYLEFGLKIILTTDQDLINDGVQAIDDKFLEWFVKNPSCEYVKVESYINGNVQRIYEILIPQEEPKLTFEEYEQQGLEKYSHEFKQETVEEFANNYSKDPFVITGVLIGAKWQAERMYSEEDMIRFAEWIANSKLHGYSKQLYEAMIIYKVKTTKDLLKVWFEQFKKKQ